MTTRDGAVGLPAVLDAYERLEAPRGGWRVVAVDDGSRDGTLGLLEGRRSRLPLTVVACPAQGLNASRNRGLSELTGDLGVFPDDDSVPRPDWLVRIRAAADAHPEVDVIACTVKARFEVEPDPWVLAAVRRGPNFAWVDLPASGPVDPTWAVGPSFAVRAARFAGGLRFDETIGPDGTPTYAMGAETELLLRLERAGAKAWYAREAFVEHRVPASMVEPDEIVRRGARFGRGRMRLRTSRVSRARLRWRGVPLSALADLLTRRLAWARARRRGDREATLRAAWTIAYLAGHVDEARRARGAAPALGACRRLLPPPLREVLFPRGASVPCRSSASSPGPA